MTQFAPTSIQRAKTRSGLPSQSEANRARIPPSLQTRLLRHLFLASLILWAPTSRPHMQNCKVEETAVCAPHAHLAQHCAATSSNAMAGSPRCEQVSKPRRSPCRIFLIRMWLHHTKFEHRIYKLCLHTPCSQLWIPAVCRQRLTGIAIAHHRRLPQVSAMPKIYLPFSIPRTQRDKVAAAGKDVLPLRQHLCPLQRSPGARMY